MDIQRQTTACFSGYRPEKFIFALKESEKPYLALREHISRAIRQAAAGGYNTFMCGMAQGFDLMAGSLFLELKEKRAEMAGLKLIAALPFKGHGFKGMWSTVHEPVRSQADEVVSLEGEFSRQAYQERNRYMVDHSSLLICYYNGRKGGTAMTVKYAEERGLSIVNVAGL